MALQFLDQTGLNPLPPGIVVTLTSIAGTIVASGYIQAGGFSTTGVSAGSFVASFVGSEAPTTSVSFTSTGASAIVTVPNYQSPAYSIFGYASEAAFDLPKLWFLDPLNTGLFPNNIGKNLYSLLLGISGPLGTQDAQNQQVGGALRLQPSQGASIDSFAYDFFAGVFYRFSTLGETDSQWISRIEAIFSTQKATVPGLQAILNVFWPWIILQILTATQNLGEDTQFGGEDSIGGEDFASNALSGGSFTAGQAIGEDAFGGEDTGTTFEDAPGPQILPPVPVVFDLVTNPTLAGYLGLTLGQFCVYIQYPSFSDTLIHSVLSPSLILSQLIAAWKDVGATAVIAQNR